MVVFCITVRHPLNSNNYAIVENLLALTLKSVLGQTDERFAVVVVCNRLPSFEMVSSQVHFVPVSFPPPVNQRGARTPLSAVYLDKGSKLISACLFATRFAPDYLYFLDADDWVESSLVAKLMEEPRPDLWYVDGGYVVNRESMRFARKQGLLRHCGSTYAWNAPFILEKLRDVPSNAYDCNPNDLVQAVNPDFYQSVLADHEHSYRYALTQQLSMRPIPGRPLCWVRATGENHSPGAEGSPSLQIRQAMLQRFSLSTDLIPPFPSEDSFISVWRESLGLLALFAGWQHAKWNAGREPNKPA